MQSIEKPETEKLFHDIEIRTNRMSFWALLFTAVVEDIFAVLGYFDITDMGPHWLCTTMISSSVITLAMCIIANKVGYSDRYSKYIFISAIIISGGITNFIYLNNMIFIIFGPTLISVLYYDRRLVLKVSCVSYAVYLSGTVANIFLDKYIPGVYEFHGNMGFEMCHYPKELIIYSVIPKTVVFLVSAVISYVLADSGKKLVLKQLELNAISTESRVQLDAAAEIQKHSMPDPDYTTQNDNICISAYLKPAKETGGDFYDYFMVDDYLLFIIVGDVSDKGLGSAFCSMQIKSIIKYAVYSERRKNKLLGIKSVNLESMLNSINDSIAHNNTNNIFLTLWIGCFDIRTGMGKYINSGHLPPVLIDKDGNIRLLENDPQIIFGVFDNVNFRSEVLKMKKGDNIVVFTDGVTDSRNKDDISFDRAGLLNALRNISSHDNLSPSLITSGIVSVLDNFASGAEQFDDITILTFNYTGDSIPETEEITVHADSEGTQIVINRINDILMKFNCPDDDRRNVDVAIDEICSNISDYAYENKEGKINVLCVYDINYLTITFRDSGIEFNPLKSDEPELGDMPCFGGLGIHLIKNLSDKLEYEYINGENILKVTKVFNI